MVQQLLSHIWKQQFRSPVWAKSLLANIFLGFAGFLLFTYVLIAGLAMDGLTMKFFPEADPIELINGILLYYFFIEFFMRFFLQNVPVLQIQPYLHLPLKKSKIIHFMLRKSQISVFNLMALLLFLPFSILRIASEHSATHAFGWIATLVGLSFANHFFTMYLKKKLNDVPNLLLGMVLFFSALVALDYFGIVSFSSLSASIFGFVIDQSILALVPFALALVAYRLNFNFLINNTYPEELAVRKKQKKVTGDFAFLKRYGRIGELIGLELKLILRHKRPRNTLIMSSFLLLYGLIFYTGDTYRSLPAIFIFAGIFITGSFFIQYGQFLLSWDSSYFDSILTRRTGLKQYIAAKYWLFVGASTIAFIISLAYGYFGWKIIFINLAAYLFNIGINVFAVMRLAMFGPKKIDLNRGAAFNYQGVGAAQFLIIIPIGILPYVLYAPLAILGYENLGILLTGLAGLIGFLFRERMLNALTNYFIGQRHKIAASFRSQ